MELPYELSYDITIMPYALEQKLIERCEKMDYKFNARKIIQSRFPTDPSSIPGLDQVFEMMAIDMESKTALEHYEYRLNSQAKLNDREHPNLPQQ